VRELHARFGAVALSLKGRHRGNKAELQLI
jgi:hypothetical protein